MHKIITHDAKLGIIWVFLRHIRVPMHSLVAGELVQSVVPDFQSFLGTTCGRFLLLTIRWLDARDLYCLLASFRRLSLTGLALGPIIRVTCRLHIWPRTE